LDAERDSPDDTHRLLARVAPDHTALQMALEKVKSEKKPNVRASRVGIAPSAQLNRSPVRDGSTPGPAGGGTLLSSGKTLVRHLAPYVCRRESLSEGQVDAERISREIEVVYGPFGAGFYLFLDGWFCLGPYKTELEVDRDLARLTGSGEFEKDFELIRRGKPTHSNHD